MAATYWERTRVPRGIDSEAASAYSSGYFMSAEQEAAAKWKTVVEYNETKAHYEMIEKGMVSLGTELQKLAERMIHQPDTVTEAHAQMIPEREAVARHGQDMRDTVKKLERLRESLHNIGVPGF